nr:hypothetical protein [Tanacetum cinerariifolium]
TNPLEGPPIAPQADEPIPDPAHAPNMEEHISSPVLEPVVQPKIDALEKELKATKKLNRDTVLLFHNRIKKLKAKVKTKSKRKLVISDSEEEEAAKDYAELEKLIHLAEAAVNEPSSFVTPSKTTAADLSQNEDISPSTVEAAQILTGGKLDPSK